MLALQLFLLLLQATPSTTTVPPGVCTGPEHRQFDFWIGDWEVRGAQGRVLGHNRITPILGGCALREEWTSADGKIVGTSHNAYDPKDRRWHQAWVDNGPSRLDLVGGLVGTEMVLEQRTAPGTSGPGDVQRITWTPLPDGGVRQHWQASKDGGKTWTTAFDGLYRRR
jgi:hypothetical protein